MQSEPSPIRLATDDDRAAVWRILEPVFRAGETYAVSSTISREAALAYWFGADRTTYVFDDPELGIIGTYYLKANQSGGGCHVCNCGYVTATEARGRGCARRMCEHSQKQAVQAGFRAMQFNLVVSTNETAVSLWQRLGFDIVGRLPGAFALPDRGDVDAFVMFKRLVEAA